jgi:RNA polymerase sigma-70 factor (ECF subfamily)
MIGGLQPLLLEQHLTLELAHHMEHSSEKIAAITDAPVNTVKARIFHAREKKHLYPRTAPDPPIGEQ